MLAKDDPMLAARFWTKVKMRTEASCWAWQGAANPQGYGQIFWKGRLHLAHRIVWQLFHGPIPASKLVLHKCDVKPCVNPHHLFLGNHKINGWDAARKGILRTARLRYLAAHPESVPHGSECHRAKLNEEQVLAIRAEYATGGTQASLVRKYGVSAMTISMIVRRVRWRHI